MSPTADISPATPLERSIGMEILAEARRKSLSHKSIQEATGIADKSFRRWFVTGERHIPFDELEKVVEVLHITMPTLMQRATDNLTLMSKDEHDSLGRAAQHRDSVDKGEGD